PNPQPRPINPSTKYPDGRAPVPEGHLPITLEDVVADMQTFSVNFGPYTNNGIFHPGFVVGDASAEILQPNFQMIVRANANALPFKGVDLSNGSVGSVTSIGKEDTALFDFSDPAWLQIEGIAPSPKVSELQFRVLESPETITAGDSPLPAPLGNGSVWQLPVWSLERVVAVAGVKAFGQRNWQKQWSIGSDPSPLFEVSIVDGWMVLVTKGDVGTPPAPLYIWDLMGLVAQRRLHDGPDPQDPDVDRIPEGQANVTFTLTDIPVGVSSSQITAAIRKNLEVDPDSLVDIAQIILDQSQGAPDFYYVRPKWSAPTVEQGDWLFFIEDSDQGQWPRSYANPGFFADEGLSQPIHTQDEVQGDVAHLKVQIVAGMRLYCEDNNGASYQIKVLDKPSEARVRLQISRLR
ncbi:MAG TPA: hypothetical protein DCQ06_06040, partial [Myxococcales bacterium]|nr:hypothetical protein [Myxococcales bacterium]